MERDPLFGFITGARLLGALALSVMAVGIFQAGRDVEHPNGDSVEIGHPVSLIGGPIASFLESSGIVDKPVETPHPHQ
ncbi:MAG TPA: hypothetical protein VII55_02390 [Candidatus Saccharimonadales bacterium]